MRIGDAGEASVPIRRLFSFASSLLAARINKNETGDTHAMCCPRIRDCNCAVAIIGNDPRHMPAWPHRNRAGMRRGARKFQPGIGAPQIANGMPEHNFARVAAARAAARTSNTALTRKPMRTARHSVGNSHHHLFLVPVPHRAVHRPRTAMKRGTVPRTVPTLCKCRNGKTNKKSGEDHSHQVHH